MAAKKFISKNSGKFGAKAEYIRSQPASMSAKDVVDAAKRVGLKVTVNHVYNIRAAAKKEGAFAPPRSVPGSSMSQPAASRRGRKPASTAISANTALEAQLRRAIAEVGLQRAREIFDSVESVFVGG
jgi:DNA uptake protein ComE-like DNA-binding protein